MFRLIKCIHFYDFIVNLTNLDLLSKFLKQTFQITQICQFPTRGC